MMDLAFLLKSYSKDVDYAARLISSFQKFNDEGIHLYCVVPETDLARFTPLEGPHVSVLPQELLASHLSETPMHGLAPGYINQEIVKLSFWELGYAANYFCVDSDAEFIRPFGVGDFLAPDGYPYTVLVEDKDLHVEPRYYREHWIERERQLDRIKELVGLHDPITRTCHGHQVFSSAVLADFRDQFLAPRGWDYSDALAESPYEFSWYNFWLQARRTIPIHAREPLVKVFHNEDQHLEHIRRGIRVADVARAYVAIVVNSNYSRTIGTIDAATSKPDLLAQYLSYGELGQVLWAKLGETTRRRWKGMRRSAG
jgi:hypothetical protein